MSDTQTTGASAMPDRTAEQTLLAGLKAFERAIHDSAWALESALAAERKGHAGYRASAQLGDWPWDRETLRRDVERAAINGAIDTISLTSMTMPPSERFAKTQIDAYERSLAAIKETGRAL